MRPTRTPIDGELDAEHEAKRLEALYALEILDTPSQELPDTRDNPRFADHPPDVGPDPIRSLVAHPLRTPDGYRVGMIVKDWLAGLAEGGAEDLGLE